MSDSADASARGSGNVPATSDKQAHYRIQQQAGRKDLWREALESSSKGDYFLISLLEVVLEDEQASAQTEEAQRAVKRLVNMEDTTVPYRANDYSEWCRSFCNEPLYKCCSVLAILGAAVVGAIEVDADSVPAAARVADFALLAWFCLECNLHIAAEGEQPQCYFFGRESESWSLAARWNVFDFSVSYASLLLATVISETGESSYRIVVLLRLLRLARLATILNKSPEMAVIVAGFVSAVNSVFYILIVLLVAFYIFAVLGVDLFSGNDPARFGSLPMAVLTLLPGATLSGWDDALYTAQYGCDHYPGALYSTNQTQSNADTDSLRGQVIETSSGDFPALLCVAPYGQHVAGAAFFTTFTLLAFIVLSLFVGIITLSMLEQMETHIRSKTNDFKAEEFRNQLEVSVNHAMEVRESLLQQMQNSSLRFTELPSAHLESKQSILPSTQLNEDNATGRRTSRRQSLKETYVIKQGFVESEDSENEDQFVDIKFEVDFTVDKLAAELEATEPLLPNTGSNEYDEEDGRRRLRRQRRMLAGAKKMNENDVIRKAMEILRSGDNFELVTEHHATELKFCINLLGRYTKRYTNFAKHCKAIVSDIRFDYSITVVVCCTAVLVVLDLEVDETNAREINEDLLYQLNFGVLGVFTSEALVKLCAEGLAPLTYFNSNWNCFDFTVVMLSYIGLAIGGSNLAILRVVRLLQLVKLTKRLKQLRVLIDALLTGFTSTSYVLALILMFNFVLGVAAVQYYKTSDSFNYGSLGAAMGTLYRIETLQNWEQAMYVGLWGCAVYSEPDLSQDLAPCEQSEAHGYSVVVFYAIIVIFGALVMPSLLVAVITAAVREANFQMKEETELEQRVVNVCNQYASVLQPKDVQAYELLFRFGDRDGSGDLSLDEIMTVLAHFDTSFGGSHFTRELASQVFMVVDKDLGGTVDRAEFFEMVGKISLVNESLSAKGLTFSEGETVSFSVPPEEAPAPGYNNNSFDSSSSHFSSSSSSSDTDGNKEVSTNVVAAPSTQRGTGAPHWQALLELAEKAVATDAATWAEWDLWELAQQQKQQAKVMAKNTASTTNDNGITLDSTPNDDEQVDLPSLGTAAAPGGSSSAGSGPLHLNGLATDLSSSYPPPQGVLVRNCTALELVQTLGPALYRLCVSGCLQTVMPPKMEAFEPSERFLGHVPNHAFGTGKFGTGYYFDQKQASGQPPGLQQRQARDAMVLARCRRVRVQSVWDFMTDRWMLNPNQGQKSGGVQVAPKPGRNHHSNPSSMIGYDVIHASLLSSSLQTRYDPLIPLSKSFPSNPSSTRPAMHHATSAASFVSTYSSKIGDEDNDTLHATETPLGLLGRLHEKLRLEMTRSQSHGRATSSTLDAFDVLHARARRCSAAHLQENSGEASKTTRDNGVESEGKYEEASEQAKKDNEHSNRQQQQQHYLYPDLHASLFQNSASTHSSSSDLPLPSGQNHPPDTSGLLHLDHLSKPHTSLNPHYPFPEPKNNDLPPQPQQSATEATPTSTAEKVPSFSGLEVASSFYSMNYPVDSALTLVGAPGWAALQPGRLLIGPAWGARFAYEQPVDGATAGAKDPGLEIVYARQVREFHGHVRWNRAREVADTLKARPHILSQADPATGNTALHIATQNELPEFVSVFLQRFGPKPAAANTSTWHQVPLAWCDVNAQNHKGNTPLHMAVEFGLLECKALLLSGGARHNICNNDGHPAIRGASGKFGLNDLASQVQARRNQKRWSLGDSQHRNSSSQVSSGPSRGTGSSGVPL